MDVSKHIDKIFEIIDKERRSKNNLTDLFMDLIFECFDSLFRCNQFEEADRILSTQANNVLNMPVDIMIGYLTSTLPAKSKLPSRKLFFDNVKSQIGDTFCSPLLKGLE